MNFFPRFLLRLTFEIDRTGQAIDNNQSLGSTNKPKWHAHSCFGATTELLHQWKKNRETY